MNNSNEVASQNLSVNHENKTEFESQKDKKEAELEKAKDRIFGAFRRGSLRKHELESVKSLPSEIALEAASQVIVEYLLRGYVGNGQALSEVFFGTKNGEIPLDILNRSIREALNKSSAGSEIDVIVRIKKHFGLDVSEDIKKNVMRVLEEALSHNGGWKDRIENIAKTIEEEFNVSHNDIIKLVEERIVKNLLSVTQNETKYIGWARRLMESFNITEVSPEIKQAARQAFTKMSSRDMFDYDLGKFLSEADIIDLQTEGQATKNWDILNPETKLEIAKLDVGQGHDGWGINPAIEVLPEGIQIESGGLMKITSIKYDPEIWESSELKKSSYYEEYFLYPKKPKLPIIKVINHADFS